MKFVTDDFFIWLELVSERNYSHVVVMVNDKSKKEESITFAIADRDRNFILSFVNVKLKPTRLEIWD